MNRWARAAPAILLGALAASAVGVASAPAGGAPIVRARHADVSNTSASDLEVTPVGSTGALSIDPGASAKRAFIITNRSATLRVTVRLAAVDATKHAGGAVQYAHAASASGPGSWLTLSDVVTTLEPGANVHVSMTVAPPGNATPGEVTAGIVARIDQAARVSDNQPVAAAGEVSLPIAIDVKGARTALVSIASVQAVTSDGHDYLDITFQNSGATPATMRGQVHVAGTHPTTDPVRTTVPPLTHTAVRVPFAMPGAGHTVPVSVTTKDASGNDATWGGAVGPEAAVASASVPNAPSSARHGSRPAPSKGSPLPSPPVIVVALLFLAAAVWLALEFKRSRAGRRARVVPPLRQATVGGAAPLSAVSNEPVAPGSVDGGQMGAVASQLAALVASIDRLVARLGEGTEPESGARPGPPVRPEPAREPVPANPAPMFFAPAARRGPDAEFDPYDWPTQQQLDDFAARRRAAQSDS
jgi:hypothetical protein